MLSVFDDLSALSLAAAKTFVAEARQQIGSSGLFTVALAGGPTLAQTYVRIAESKSQIEWSKVHFFWTDEKDLPQSDQKKSDEQSNFNIAQDTLISSLDVPEENIHRIKLELGTAKAADKYNREIIGFFRAHGILNKAHIPCFDFISLNMGDDGATAGLFPETIALMEKDKLVVENYIAKLNQKRITFTAKLINSARFVLFVVSGQIKARALKDIFEDSIVVPPAKLIKAAKTSWYVDKAAASMLK